MEDVDENDEIFDRKSFDTPKFIDHQKVEPGPKRFVYEDPWRILGDFEEEKEVTKPVAISIHSNYERRTASQNFQSSNEVGGF
jgi:hypothetical protein